MIERVLAKTQNLHNQLFLQRQLEFHEQAMKTDVEIHQ